MYGYIIQEWIDPRLKRKPGPAGTGNDKKLIWTPDDYCVNCRFSSIGGERMLRIEYKGNVYFSQK